MLETIQQRADFIVSGDPQYSRNRTNEAIIYNWDGTVERSLNPKFVLHNLADNKIAALVIPRFFTVEECNLSLTELLNSSNNLTGLTQTEQSIKRLGYSRHTALSEAHKLELTPYTKDWFEFIGQNMIKGETSVGITGHLFINRLQGLLEHMGYSSEVAHEKYGEGEFKYCPAGVRFFPLVTGSPTLAIHHDRLDDDGYLRARNIDYKPILDKSCLGDVSSQFGVNVSLSNTQAGETVIFNATMDELKKVRNASDFRTQGGYMPKIVEQREIETGLLIHSVKLHIPLGGISIFNTHNAHMVKSQLMDTVQMQHRIRIHNFIGWPGNIPEKPIQHDHLTAALVKSCPLLFFT